VNAEIERRKSANIPLDDGKGPLEPVGPFVPDPALDDVRVKCRVLKAKDTRMIQARERDAVERAATVKTHAETAAVVDELFAIKRDIITASVVALDIGGASFAEFSEDTLDMLEKERLAGPISSAAMAFQDLGPKKAALSGSSAVSTSQPSTAAHAESSLAKPVAVMVGPETSMAGPTSSEAPVTQQTRAPGGI
jgi:hypothetical protein